jgi:signal transduction histidine kinase
MDRRWARPLQSVRLRITLAAVAVTALAVGAAGWLLVRSVEGAQVSEVRRDVNASLDEVVRRLADGQDPEVALTGGALGPARVTVTDERGQLVTLTPEPAEDADVGAEERGGDELAADDVPGGDEQILGDVETLARAVETADGELFITAVVPVDQVARNIEALTDRLAIGLPALVALVGVIAWVLVGRALRPVESMRAEAERITASTMHHRVPEPPTHDEVGRLARTMNSMLDRLEAAAAQQRRFVSDASHELRSPVATLRVGLEVARAKPGPADWAARVDSLLAEESRLESLLDDLLLLAAHDEHGTTAAPARSVNLTALAIDEGRRPRRVPVHVVQTPADNRAVVVAGVQQQLARALSNLVDNAARHAASVVQISVSNDGDTVRVAVDDDGPGIPPTHRERVFERFTRLDDGRARHDGGSGLGLAVVRSILTSHNGTIRIDDSPLGGARFVVELPALPS